MTWSPIFLSAWPGLPRLWCRGQIPALIIAIVFALFVNLALVSTFIWPQLLGSRFPVLIWPPLLLFWAISTLSSLRTVANWSELPPVAGPDDSLLSDQMFVAAQHLYLIGQWAGTEGAETKLVCLLDAFPRDIEARLMLATLFRHSRRLDEASEQLDTLLKFDESVNWKLEIDRERMFISEILAETAAETD